MNHRWAVIALAITFQILNNVNINSGAPASDGINSAADLEDKENTSQKRAGDVDQANTDNIEDSNSNIYYTAEAQQITINGKCMNRLIIKGGDVEDKIEIPCSAGEMDVFTSKDGVFVANKNTVQSYSVYGKTTGQLQLVQGGKCYIKTYSHTNGEVTALSSPVVGEACDSMKKEHFQKMQKWQEWQSNTFSSSSTPNSHGNHNSVSPASGPSGDNGSLNTFSSFGSGTTASSSAPTGSGGNKPNVTPSFGYKVGSFSGNPLTGVNYGGIALNPFLPFTNGLNSGGSTSIIGSLSNMINKPGETISATSNNESPSSPGTPVSGNSGGNQHYESNAQNTSGGLSTSSSTSGNVPTKKPSSNVLTGNGLIESSPVTGITSLTTTFAKPASNAGFNVNIPSVSNTDASLSLIPLPSFLSGSVQAVNNLFGGSKPSGSEPLSQSAGDSASENLSSNENGPGSLSFSGSLSNGLPSSSSLNGGFSGGSQHNPSSSSGFSAAIPSSQSLSFGNPNLLSIIPPSSTNILNAIPSAIGGTAFNGGNSLFAPMNGGSTTSGISALSELSLPGNNLVTGLTSAISNISPAIGASLSNIGQGGTSSVFSRPSSWWMFFTGLYDRISNWMKQRYPSLTGREVQERVNEVIKRSF